jgi:hypothetical protein
MELISREASSIGRWNEQETGARKKERVCHERWIEGFGSGVMDGRALLVRGVLVSFAKDYET